MPRMTNVFEIKTGKPLTVKDPNIEVAKNISEGIKGLIAADIDLSKSILIIPDNDTYPSVIIFSEENSKEYSFDRIVELAHLIQKERLRD